MVKVSVSPLTGSVVVTVTDGNTALPASSANVTYDGGVTVSVPHVPPTPATHEMPLAVATMVVSPAALPVAWPNELMLATVGFVLCHCTVGDELDPPTGLPPVPPPLTNVCSVTLNVPVCEPTV